MGRFIRPLIAAAAIVICACTSREAKNVSRRNDLPAMAATLIEGSTVQLKEQTGDVILVFFLSDCEHCQREAEAVANHLPAFSDYDIYFLSNEPADIQRAFAERFGLQAADNFHFGRVEVSEIISNFGAIPTPSMYIYADRVLIQKFLGETPIEEILKVL